jgi:hypothetical protein
MKRFANLCVLSDKDWMPSMMILKYWCCYFLFLTLGNLAIEMNYWLSMTYNLINSFSYTTNTS